MLSLTQVKAEDLPYPHIVLKNAAPNFGDLLREFPKEDSFSNSIRMHADLTAGDVGYENLLEHSKSWRSFHEYVYSKNFIKDFLVIFDSYLDQEIQRGTLIFDPRDLEIRAEVVETREALQNKSLVGEGRYLYSRLDFGIGKLHYGAENGGGGIHTDNASRLISILLYMNGDPTMLGGEHRMYSLDGYEPKLEKIYRPEANMLIASLQTNRALHDVNPITRLSVPRLAVYMAVSCSEKIWREDSDSHLQKLTKNRWVAPKMTTLAKLKAALGVRPKNNC